MSRKHIDPVLTSDKFEIITWHDCPVYAFSINHEDFSLALDLDFIIEWIHPGETWLPFNYYISPATLIFENARNIQIVLRTSYEPLLINRIERTGPKLTPNGMYIDYRWIIDCHNGSIELLSTGFTQYLRLAPQLSSEQRISFIERNGVSFSRTPFQETE